MRPERKEKTGEGRREERGGKVHVHVQIPYSKDNKLDKRSVQV